MTWNELDMLIHTLPAAQRAAPLRFVSPRLLAGVLPVTARSCAYDLRAGDGEEEGTAVPAGQLFLCEETVTLEQLDTLFGAEHPELKPFLP